MSDLATAPNVAVNGGFGAYDDCPFTAEAKFTSPVASSSSASTATSSRPIYPLISWTCRAPDRWEAFAAAVALTRGGPKTFVTTRAAIICIGGSEQVD